MVLIAGAQSEHAAWALVYGLAEREGRRPVLVLPHDAAFATMQRVPWLTEESRPEIWLHQDSALQDAPAPERSRLDTIEAVRAHASEKSNGAGPAGELRAASTPKYLGEQSAGVRHLVEWATSHPQLEAAHNQSTRSWLCAGQKVLSLDSGPGLVQVRAGIHDKQRMSAPDESVAPGQALTPGQVEVLQQNVASAIAARIEPGGRYCKPDEHWFQSVLRRDPSLVGVESPALREVPAWRAAGAAGSFGRGFVDLLGLDGHGDIRIVEAKLAKSSDDMTLIQGIDYHVWAHAYRCCPGREAVRPGRRPAPPAFCHRYGGWRQEAIPSAARRLRQLRGLHCDSFPVSRCPGLAHQGPLLAAGDQYAVIPYRRDPDCEHAMRAPASDATFSARPSIGSACRALQVDAQISQLRIARQATGSGQTGVPNGGYARPRPRQHSISARDAHRALPERRRTARPQDRHK